MKLFAAILISAFSLSAFSATVAETISKLEAGNDVSCARVNKSRDICLGLAVDAEARKTIPCWSTETFECSGAEEFKAKLRVKTQYNTETGKRESKVTKVSIIN